MFLSHQIPPGVPTHRPQTQGAQKKGAQTHGLRVFAAARSTPCPLRLFASSVAAGFPSPAEDYVEGRLDLNEHLIRHPAATFIVRVAGESMTGAGIYPGDLLIVDRSIEARGGDVVIAVVNGELTVKRLQGRTGQWRLVAENPDFPPIPIIDDMECVIWGVVSGSVRRFQRR